MQESKLNRKDPPIEPERSQMQRLKVVCCIQVFYWWIVWKRVPGRVLSARTGVSLVILFLTTHYQSHKVDFQKESQKQSLLLSCLPKICMRALSLFQVSRLDSSLNTRVESKVIYRLKDIIISITNLYNLILFLASLTLSQGLENQSLWVPW